LDVDVSIRAPRAGRDARQLDATLLYMGFNPRAPRGARRDRLERVENFLKFQSARPARGATLDLVVLDLPVQVSIRAPRAGRDAAS